MAEIAFPQKGREVNPDRPLTNQMAKRKTGKESVSTPLPLKVARSAATTLVVATGIIMSSGHEAITSSTALGMVGRNPRVEFVLPDSKIDPKKARLVEIDLGKPKDRKLKPKPAYRRGY